MCLCWSHEPQETRLHGRGYGISEQLELPVLFRTTTRVAHMRGDVVFGDRRPVVRHGVFEKDPSRFVPVPANSSKMHVKLLGRLAEARLLSEASSLNHIVDVGGGGTVGIVTAGSAFNYVVDALEELGLCAQVFKVGFSYPLPLDRIREFATGVDELLVVEELEPLMEIDIKADFLSRGTRTPVCGKEELLLPRVHELNVDVVARALANHFRVPLHAPASSVVQPWSSPLPSRPPVLCPGGPHRGSYLAVRRAKGELVSRTIFASDIGCYTLGMAAPFCGAVSFYPWDSSVGAAGGFDWQPIERSSRSSVTVRSSSGRSALASATHNKHRFGLTVLDNGRLR